MKIGILIILVASFCSVFSTELDEWITDVVHRYPRDCLWTAWYSDRRCIKIGPEGTNLYGYKRYRRMIRALNGGKNCTGVSEEHLPCTETDYLATSLLTAIGSASIKLEADRSKPREGRKPSQDSANATACVDDHVDSRGNVRMAGRPCALGTTKTRVDSQEVSATNAKDVLFLLDKSASVGRNLSKFFRLAKAITNSFCGPVSIAKDLTRIGMMTFDRTQHPILDFDQYFVRAELIDHVDAYAKSNENARDDTCLVDALSYTRDQMFARKRGARVNIPGVERLAVLMTDSCDDCRNQGELPTALMQMRETLEKQGISLITVLVGSNPTCVKTMSALADGSQCYQVFRAMDFDELDMVSRAVDISGCVSSWKISPGCSA